MKQQIARFSPHQNAKVLAVLMTVGSLVFLVPMMLFMSMASPREAQPPFLFFVAMPLLYLVFGYISVAIGCLIYNQLVKYTGGFEFETDETRERA